MFMQPISRNLCFFALGGRSTWTERSHQNFLSRCKDWEEQWTSIPKGVVRLDNTAKRKQDLEGLMSTMLQHGKVSHVEAQQLRGKLVFGDNQVHGRLGPLLLKALSNHIHRTPFTSAIDDPLMMSDSRRRDRITSGDGREIRAIGDNTYYVFTDAFFEPRNSDKGPSASVGGLVFDWKGNVVAWFSRMLGEDELNQLLRSSQKSLSSIALVERHVLLHHGVALHRQQWCQGLDNKGKERQWSS